MRARPGRTAAVVGAVVAVSATTLMGFAGIAAAMVPGTCTENVNVRAEPDINSRIVALCEAGTAVTTGATRNGFIRLTELGGWASAQYVAVEEAQPAPAGPAPSTATGPTTPPAPADEDETGSGDELRQEPTGTEPSITDERSTDQPTTTGRGAGDGSPGRNTFTPDDSDTSPSAPDDDSPGLGGLL